MMAENKTLSLAEKKKLLSRVTELSFALVEMAEYLDTHPYEKEAIDYFTRLNKAYLKAKKEYSESCAYLSLDLIEQTDGNASWKWALEDLPWR